MPAGLEHRRAAVEEDADIADMLDHLHRQHDVEALAHVHLFHRGAAIVDRQMSLVGMQLGGRDVAGGGIDADHLGAEPGERLAQQPGAAADVEDAQARQAVQALDVALELAAGGVADIGEPQRIDLVQRRHLAVADPTTRSDSFENFAISAGSTVVARGVGRRRQENFAAWPWLTRRSYRAVMALRNASGEAMVEMVSLPSPTPQDGDVAVIEDAAQNALVDVDALDLVEAHLEGAALDEAGLVDDAHVGDVGLGGPAMEPGLHRPVQRHEPPPRPQPPDTSPPAMSLVVVRDSTRSGHRENPAHDRRQIEDPVRVGRIQHLLAGLQDFVDITPHTLASLP